MPWPKGKVPTMEHRMKVSRSLLGNTRGRSLKGIPKTTEHVAHMLRPKLKTPGPTKTASTKDLAWAAGFLEGEGHFGTKTGQKGNPARYPRVGAAQVNREPLEKLQVLFGGAIRFRVNREHPCHYWELNGTRAIGVMMTLYGLLSGRRRTQIQRAFCSEVSR